MSSRSDDRDEMARDLIGVCSSATNCLTHTVDPDGTVWLSSTRRPDVRLRVDPDEWPSRPATLGGPGELADARYELDVLRGIATDLEQRLDLALTDCARALAERDEALAIARRMLDPPVPGHRALVNAVDALDSGEAGRDG